MNSNEVRDSILSAPPVAASGAVLMGYSLQDWVLVLTIGWLVIQIGSWGYDRFYKRKASDDAK